MIQRLHRPRRRDGVAAVEFAFLAPFFVFLLIGAWEGGRMLQIQQSLSNAAREGGRQASTGLRTNTQIQQVVTDYLNRASVPTANAVVTVTVTGTGGPDATQAVQMDQILVTVSVPVSDFRWIGLTLVTNSSTRITGQATWYSLRDQDFPTTPDPMPGS